jgi:NADH-quinone oxidoreductase subunit M
MSGWWLIALGCVPLLGAVIVALLGNGRDLLAKQLTLAFSLATLGIAAYITSQFNPSGPRFQVELSYSWIKAFGVSFAVGVDGIALVLVLLIGVLVPVVVIASWNEEMPGNRSPKAFFAWLLVLEMTMIGVFVATDVFLFYVFFEVMLVPMYFLIGSFGGPRRHYAAMKFFLYSLLGGMILLAAVIALYFASPAHSFAFSELVGNIDPGYQKLLFFGFFIAFAIKAPLVPFHTWLPDAGAEAPIGGSVLLVGVLDKVATFGFLRYCLPLFPDASRFFAPMILILGVIGIIYVAIVAASQQDMKRLVSYTSVAHFGFIAIGIFAFTTQGGSGAVLYMVNHGLSTGMLFIVVGIVIARGKSRLISDYGGMARVAPWTAGVFLFAGLSALALPGLSTFVSEFLTLVGTFSRHMVYGTLATVGIIFAAIYILWMYQRIFHGPEGRKVIGFKDLTGREAWAVGPLLVLIIFLGVYPKPILAVINPAVKATMSDVGQTDPAPTSALVGVQK